MLSPENQALLAKLSALHERAANGDQEARHVIQSWKTRALRGDPQSKRLYNTLAVIHWQKRQGQGGGGGPDYAKAEMYYRRLAAKEPRAMAKLQLLLQRVRAGDPDSLTLFRVLKSIHHKYKSSVFTDGPGAPRVGGYGMPEHHRPGIVIGGVQPLVDCAERGRLFYPTTSGVPMYGTYGAARPGRPFGVAGINIGAVEPLTADAVTRLIGLMVKVRGLAAGASAANLITSPGSFLQGATSFVPAPGSSVSSPVAVVRLLPDQIAAFKSGYATTQGELNGVPDERMNGIRYSNGQMLAAVNAEIASLRAARSQGPEWDYGFFIGTATSLGNSVEGPGQNAARACMQTSNLGPVNVQRVSGFDAARAQQYDLTRRGWPNMRLPEVAKSVGIPVGVKRITNEERAAKMQNQTICNQAADAAKRGSPAAAQLAAMCTQARVDNIMAGQYFADNMSPNDGRYRVALTDAGAAVIAKNPQLQTFLASLASKGGVFQRGFTMAMGVRAGQVDPKFLAFVRPGLSGDPNLIAGFDFGMSMQ